MEFRITGRDQVISLVVGRSIEVSRALPMERKWERTDIIGLVPYSSLVATTEVVYVVPRLLVRE